MKCHYTRPIVDVSDDPHENGCQFCEETRPHHHEWGSFGQRTVLEECTAVAP